MKAFEDPNNPGNGPKYRTKNKCIEEGCAEFAGTAWGKYWCFAHNVERMHRIDVQMKALLGKFEDSE